MIIAASQGAAFYYPHVIMTLTPEEFHDFVVSTIDKPESFLETLDSTINFLNLCHLLFRFHQTERFVAFKRQLRKGVNSERDNTHAAYNLVPLLCVERYTEAFRAALAALEEYHDSITNFTKEGCFNDNATPRRTLQAHAKDFAKVCLELKNKQKINDVKAILDISLE